MLSCRLSYCLHVSGPAAAVSDSTALGSSPVNALGQGLEALLLLLFLLGLTSFFSPMLPLLLLNP